jgi:hypothetical protein
MKESYPKSPEAFSQFSMESHCRFKKRVPRTTLT